jgi:hypothetical protein
MPRLAMTLREKAAAAANDMKRCVWSKERKC